MFLARCFFEDRGRFCVFNWQDREPSPVLRHDVLEKELMDSGMTQYEAHIEASLKYNYGKESDDYYAALKEHKNRGKNSRG